MINKMSSSIFIALIVIFSETELLLTIASKFDVPERLSGNNESIVPEIEDFKAKFELIDLGDGAPDFLPPKNLRTALSNAVLGGDAKLNQYTRDLGLPRLVNALGKYYSKLLNRTVDPANNLLITVGATEALFITLQSHTHQDDEWIIIEPYYEPYLAMVKAALGVPRFITLKPTKLSNMVTSDDWTFDREDMAGLFNERTKGILVNNPHNPIGKVFTLEELTFIADLTRKWNTLVVYDEVYQFLVFDKKEHIRMATLPGMFERTISIGSGGKAFSATGWRLGWAYGGAKVLSNLRAIHSNIVISVPTAIQEAFAITFEDELKNFGNPKSYVSTFKKTVELKRNYITKALTKVGMIPIIPSGGFFIVANWTTFSDKINLDEEKDTYKDAKFSKLMLKNANVIGFPISSYYNKEGEHLREDGIRYCFVKKDKTLRTAINSLLKWKNQIEQY